MGIECFRVQFPKSMDANEYALKVQPASKSLGIMLNRAAWLGKGERPTVAVIEPVKAEAVKIEPPPPEPAPQIEAQRLSNQTSRLPPHRSSKKNQKKNQKTKPNPQLKKKMQSHCQPLFRLRRSSMNQEEFFL